MERNFSVNLGQELISCSVKEEVFSSPVELSRLGARNETAKARAGRSTQRGKKQKSYYWKPQENRKYVDFLRANRQTFSLSSRDKKKLKLNVLMSKAVKTRSPTQCHTHHQKMMARFGSLQAIILSAFPDDSRVLPPSKQEMQSPTVECLDLLELSQQQLSGLDVLDYSIQDYFSLVREEHENMRWLDGFID